MNGNHTKSLNGDPTIRFNANQTMWVKLRPEGIEILRKYHEETFRAYPPGMRPFAPPGTDEDGYSRWQMWAFFQIFGSHLTMGGRVPFETDIYLDPRS